MKRILLCVLIFSFIPLASAFDFDTATQLTPTIYFNYPTQVVEGSLVPISVAVNYEDFVGESLAINLSGGVIASEYIVVDNATDYAVKTYVVRPTQSTLNLTFTGYLNDTVVIPLATIPSDVTPTDISGRITALTEDIRQLLPIDITPFNAEEYIEDGATVPFEKTVQTIQTEYSNTSVITIKVDTQDFDEVYVIELIPKELAEDVSEIYFSVDPIIVQVDPVIMWDTESLTQEVQYTLEGNDVSGNTVLVAKKSKQHSLLPLLAIPLVALLIIFFARFSPKK